MNDARFFQAYSKNGEHDLILPWRSAPFGNVKFPDFNTGTSKIQITDKPEANRDRKMTKRNFVQATDKPNGLADL